MNVCVFYSYISLVSYITSSRHVTQLSIISAGVSTRVPGFLKESPYDTGVTRGVKKAYGTMDSLRYIVIIMAFLSVHLIVLV